MKFVSYRDNVERKKILRKSQVFEYFAQEKQKEFVKVKEIYDYNGKLFFFVEYL